MNFKILVEQIVNSVPEFLSYLTEKPQEDYSNAFLGDFGIFTVDAIVRQKPYSSRCLNTINFLVNNNVHDKDLINKLVINTLEILTDEKLTQKAAVNIFDGKCLELFLNLLDTQFTNLLND